MHEGVPSDVTLPELESRVLELWRDRDIASQTLKSRQGRNEYVFFEGPPTANAKPGTHHIMARAFKDLYTRFATMRGYHVPRKAGWDCHGLPVEIEIERKLGFTHKQQVIDYGVEAFNALCRASVTEYTELWKQFSERVGYWLDFDDAYQTMDNRYIESVWWSLAQLHNKGLLYESDRVAPYCPRCETPLSDHELGQPDVYRDVSDPSAYVGFELLDGPMAGAHLAVWTTTPWTLISNLAVAVNPEVSYCVVVHDSRRLVVASDLMQAVAGEGASAEQTLTGAQLIGSRYKPPFDFALQAKPELAETAWRVIGADFVTTDDGTGLVHMAPAFGADDLEACRAAGIETFNPVGSSGEFTALAGQWAGRFVKEADADIISDLAARGLLIRSESYLHSYPHCWRCKSPLLYYALVSWYIRTTEFRDRLVEVNSKVNWVPEHIREGRYGNWLKNNVDWSLSRFRFWGTPLPIWRCELGHATVVESASDLGQRAGRDLHSLDLHRPFVDEITFDCPECGQVAHRVSDLIDVWYDSGAMPFAQHGYPHHNIEDFRRQFPADFIAEAIDQTRGWFYTLMAEGVMLFDDSPYRNVVCHGHLVDGDGRKMSKSLGNVIDPWELFASHGADVLRFFFFTAGQPGDSRRISTDALDQVVRRPFMTLWNIYRLYVTYANIDGFDPTSTKAVPPAKRPALDRWILSELHMTIQEVTQALEAYDATAAGRRIITLVDDLSNWYVRRSRRRFWRNAENDEQEAEKNSAYFTLWTCLSELAKLLAPLAPFLSEAMYQNLVVTGDADAPPSVHMCDFPKADASLIDATMAQSMSVIRTLASLGHSARNDAAIKVRRPLREAVLLVPDEYRDQVADLSAILTDELNIRQIRFADELANLVDVTLRPNFKNAGPDFGPKVGELAKALSDPRVAAVAADVAATLEGGQEVDVDLDSGEIIRVSARHVDIRREPAAGTAFEYEAPYGVSLHLELDDELRQEGLIRELVHILQNLRKTSGLDVTDRIVLSIDGPPEVMEAVAAFDGWIREELLAVDIQRAPIESEAISVDGYEVRASIRKA